MENGFSYSYSAQENKEVQEIRNRYLPKEQNKLEQLKKLDRKVQNAGIIESLCVGISGCLVFGVGMCMGLKAIAGGMAAGIILGIIGATIMLGAYPVYKKVSAKVKEDNVAKILKLADEIEKNI